jgi:hypothetical protein
VSATSDQIAIDALKAASVSNDGVTVTRRSLKEQIEADRYLRDIAATPTNAASLFMSMNFKIVPPGGH